MKTKHTKIKGDVGKKLKDTNELYSGKKLVNPKKPEPDDKPVKTGTRATRMKALSKKLEGKVL